MTARSLLRLLALTHHISSNNRAIIQAAFLHRRRGCNTYITMPTHQPSLTAAAAIQIIIRIQTTVVAVVASLVMLVILNTELGEDRPKVGSTDKNLSLATNTYSNARRHPQSIPFLLLETETRCRVVVVMQTTLQVRLLRRPQTQSLEKIH